MSNDTHRSGQKRRRIQLSNSTQLQAVTVGLMAGVVLALVGLRPTGDGAVDVVVLAAACAFVTWCAATTVWWALVVAAMIGAVLVPLGIATALGLALMTAGAAIGVRRHSLPFARATLVAATMVLYGLCGNVGRFGVTTAVGVVVMSTLAVMGMSRRPRASRKRARRIVLGVAAFCLVAVGVAGLSVLRARGQLERGNDEARAGLASLRNADFEAASDHFRNAGSSFDEASSVVSAPWVQPVRLVPIAAQYWRVGDELSSNAAEASFTLGNAAAATDFDSLKPVDGTIDLDAVADARRPLQRTAVAAEQLDEAVAASRSPWLLPAVDDRLGDIAADVHDQRVLSSRALDAVEVAPAMLGRDGERRYFVMFTTPAEARGQGGFMGNYAIVTANRGTLEVSELGRHSDLSQAMPDDAVLTHAPPDWMQQYGPYGFQVGDSGHVEGDAWSIIDLSAHFPYTAQVIDELYPIVEDDDLDGVFLLDVYALEALIGVVGPVNVDGAPELTGRNTADYLLFGQYRSLPLQPGPGKANSQRIDRLDDVAHEVIDRLLSGSPDPIELGQALAPAARDGRVLAWSQRPDEEALFVDIDVDGQVLDRQQTTPAEGGHGADSTYLHFAINNSGGNKIDSFLAQEVTINDGGATITYTNTAPERGLPWYVIGSANQDIPVGTNRAIVTVYATDAVERIDVDGVTLGSTPGTEAERHTYQFSIMIPSGQSVSVHVVTAGSRAVVPALQPLVPEPVER